MTDMTVFQTQSTETTVQDDDFDAMSSGGGLPRLSLKTSNSDEVKSGDFPTNTYALEVGELRHELGKNIDIVICAYRLTALLSTEEGFCSSHEAKSDLFQSIMKTANDEGYGSGALYGQEFLVWVPEHKMLATLFCNSKTSRNMAAGIKTLVGEVATMGSKKISKMIKNKTHEWYGMTVAASNAVITELPDPEAYQTTLDAFLSEVGVQRELADDSEPESDRD